MFPQKENQESSCPKSRALHGEACCQDYQDLARFLKSIFGQPRTPLIHLCGAVGNKNLIWAALISMTRVVSRRLGVAKLSLLVIYARQQRKYYEEFVFLLFFEYASQSSILKLLDMDPS